jgi:hypothetical protein
MSDCSLQLFTNNAVALLQTSIAPTDLVIQVQPGLGSLFPQPTNAGEWFLITLETIAAPFQREIVKVIGRAGDTFIVDPAGRGWESTTPAAWIAGETLIDHRVTAGTLRCFQQAKSSNFGDNTLGLWIDIGGTENASSLDVTGMNRSCKWLVTIETADSRICMIELLAVYKPGNPIWNRYSKIGDTVSVGFDVVDATTEMILTISNTDLSDFVKVDVMRLQHYV